MISPKRFGKISTTLSTLLMLLTGMTVSAEDKDRLTLWIQQSTSKVDHRETPYVVPPANSNFREHGEPSAVKPAGAADPLLYRFRRLWPALQQPWYFGSSEDVAVDDDGFIYTVDRENNRAFKISLDGRLVTAITPGINSPCCNFSPWGVAVGSDGQVYFSVRDRVTVFTPDGDFLTEFGNDPDDPSQLVRAKGIDVGLDGSVYVVDSFDRSVLKYTREGQFIDKFPITNPVSNGPDSNFDIAISDDNRIYITDDGNQTLSILSADGELVSEQVGFSFVGPDGVEVGSDGNIYISDGNVNVFDRDGTFLRILPGPYSERVFGVAELPGGGFVTTGFSHVDILDAQGRQTRAFRSSGNELGRFQFLGSVGIAPNGNVYASEGLSRRISIFSPDGESLGVFPNNGFEHLVFDNAGNIYGTNLNALTKLDPNGQELFVVEGSGSGPGEFDGAMGIALSPDESFIYVVDITNTRVQRFAASDGAYIDEFNTTGQGGTLPWTIAVAANGDLFVTNNSFVEVYGDDYVFKRRWPITDEPTSAALLGIALDDQGNVYVSENAADSIRIFDDVGTPLGQIGGAGFQPGQLNIPAGLAFDNLGRLYVADIDNNRVQVFEPVTPVEDTRAIIVTGGGPYPGNALWEATQVNANFAFRTLAYQGFSKSTVQYLSADTDLDLDFNMLSDEVDADTTVDNFREAILGPTGDGRSGFAAGADSLIIYMVDHGGFDSFRMSGSEILQASQLGAWLDTWQEANGSPVTIVYDACQSGSFMEEITSTEHDRLVIASSTAEQSAYFVSQGTLSFSNFFWTQIFNGFELDESYNAAATVTSQTFPSQTPLLDGDGDGLFNTAADFALADGRNIGNGTLIAGTAPVIADVIPQQQMSANNSATLRVSGVVDSDGIGRVWAIVRPPGFNPGSPNNPVSDLPTFEFTADGPAGEYVATFGGFNDPGTYQLSIYAVDSFGNTAVPVAAQVIAENPLTRKALVVMGAQATDSEFLSRVVNAELAHAGLVQQGYGEAEASCNAQATSLCDSICDNVCWLSADVNPAVDAPATMANFEHAVRTWGADVDSNGEADVIDLTIYLIAPGSGSTGYHLNDSETLTSSLLSEWIDSASSLISGEITLVIEGSDSEAFLSNVATRTADDHYLIGSTSSGETSALLVDGQVSFSRFFWTQVLNGSDTFLAFQQARSAIRFSNDNPGPVLDDNGNGIANEFFDGLNVRRFAIGSGVLLAGDDPVIGDIQAGSVITGPGFGVAVSGVTSTADIEVVVGIVSARTNGATLVEHFSLNDQGAGNWSASVPGLDEFSPPSDIAIYAIDSNGNASLPKVVAVQGANVLFVNGFE